MHVTGGKTLTLTLTLSLVRERGQKGSRILMFARWEYK